MTNTKSSLASLLLSDDPLTSASIKFNSEARLSDDTRVPFYFNLVSFKEFVVLIIIALCMLIGQFCFIKSVKQAETSFFYFCSWSTFASTFGSILATVGLPLTPQCPLTPT